MIVRDFRTNKENNVLPMGITAYHPMAQPATQHSECSPLTIENPCKYADCQSMCLLSKDASGFGVRFRCACPIGQVGKLLLNVIRNSY